jgi:hypothetical protein
MSRRFRLLACAALVARAAAAQTTPVPVSQATRLTGTIHVDGRLDDAAWKSAPVTDAFTQIDPDEGKPASERTEVRVLYDDDAIYVGVRLHDGGRVTGRLGRRDMPLGDSDWFGLMLDSYHDHRTAFGFDVNPAGVRRDEVKTIDVDDNSWDAVWDVATSVDAGGWTAEYRIPFSQLRFGRDSVQTWGVQFERLIGRKQEYDVSTFIPKKDRGGVPQYGHLAGLTGLHAGKRLELLPYTVSRAEYVDPHGNPFRTKHEYGGSAGLDLRYRAASNVTLVATINPDFGQVEVDPAVVNLGVYETFFDEKRPFFLEGSEIFDFGLGNTSGGQLFYSRRIGRAPTLGAPTALADVPTTTTILGAAKLSGKIAGWSVGSLAAVTAREDARYRVDDVLDSDARFAVEPRSEYFVGRARREYRGGGTIVGGALTAVHRDLSTDALRAALRSEALAGGVDFRHEWGNRGWQLRGDAEGSLIRGSARSIALVETASNHFFQRPDADHLAVDVDPGAPLGTAASLGGYSASAGLTKQAGAHWRGDVAAAATSPGYEVNDLGFSYRTDRRDAALSVTYRETRPGKHLRRWQVTPNVRSEHNTAWEPILTVGGVNANLLTTGYWTYAAAVRRQFRSFDDRLTRGGPIAVRPANVSANASFSSDGRKPATVDGGAVYQNDESGGWTYELFAGVGVKTSSRWNLRVGPDFTKARVTAQYVTAVRDTSYAPTYGARYVFAPLAQTQLALETRLNVTFTRDLSLETYVQPLLSSADYGAARQLVRARTYDFVDYAGRVPDRDFNLRSLRGNAVLRWEYRPGSTLYVAWQQMRQGIAPVGDFAFGRDRAALFATRPDNILVVKASYWLNP